MQVLTSTLPIRGHTGGVTLGGNIGTDSAAGSALTTLGNPKTTGTITLSGVEYNTSDDQAFTAAAFALGGANVTFATSSDPVDFTVSAAGGGDVTLADAANLTINTVAGNITFGGDILGTDNGESTSVTLNTTGTVSVKSIGADGSTADNNINDVTLTGGTVSLNGTISTAVLGGEGETKATDLGDVDINGAVTLAGATTIDTSSSGGTVHFNSTINGGQNLTIKSGAGRVDLAGVVGGTTAIGNLVINAASASHTGAGAIYIDDIGDTDVTAAAGTVNVGNSNTATIDLTGDIYRIGASVFTATSGDNINLTDASGNVEFDLANASLEFASKY